MEAVTLQLISIGAVAALFGGIAFAVINNPIPVPCLGCDEGGLFYKCTEGTGKGSAACDAFERGERLIDEAQDLIADVTQKAQTLQEDIQRPINATFAEINRLKTAIGEAIPPVQVPNLNVDMTCGFEVPLLGEVNVCKGVGDGINAGLSGLNIALNALGDGLNVVVAQMNNIVGTILSPVANTLSDFASSVVAPWQAIQADINSLLQDINGLLEIIAQMNIFDVIVSQISDFLLSIFPFASVTVIAAAAAFFTVGHFVGSFFGFYMFMRDIINIMLLPITIPVRAALGV